MNRRTKTQARKKRAAIVWSIVAAVVVLLGVGGGIAWAQFGDRISLALGWTTNDYVGEGSGEVTVVIRSGDDGTDLANQLAELDVVKTPEAFISTLAAQDEEPMFHPGAFQLRSQMSAQAALDALLDPANELDLRVTIPEGKTVEQTIRIISEQSTVPLEDMKKAVANLDAFALPAGVESLEGWLFPATYEFEIDTTGEEAVHLLFDTQLQVLDEFGVAEADRERVLTIASIVQREAGQVDDFGKVSRVIANRLEKDMKLEMDSTAHYGIGAHEDGDVWTSDEARADQNPWNTYAHTGLPVGPIANAGRDAIAAALSPTPGDWVYFVNAPGNDGTLAFNSTLTAHEKSVDEFRAWCNATPDSGC